MDIQHRVWIFLKGVNDGEVYYLVPNGKNHQHPIQPNQIAARLNHLNKHQGSFLIDLIRCLKYWCRERLLPKIPNPLLEAIVFDYCDSKLTPLSEFSDYLKADNARHFEQTGKVQRAVDKWSEVFGREFKKYSAYH